MYARPGPEPRQAAERLGAFNKTKNEELNMSDRLVFIYAATRERQRYS